MQTNTLRARVALVLALTLTVTLLATSCSYFLGSTTDIIPLPTDVQVKPPPRIVSVEATFIERSCQDYYERVYGLYCWDWWIGYYYCSRNVWRYKDCVGDITLRLLVDDPSDDLDPSKAPRVRVFDSTPAPGSGTGNICLMNVPQTDITILSTDVTGAGPTKTVVVRLRNIRVKFTSNCRTFAANLPMRIVFTDGPEELASINEYVALVEYKR